MKKNFWNIYSAQTSICWVLWLCLTVYFFTALQKLLHNFGYYGSLSHSFMLTNLTRKLLLNLCVPVIKSHTAGVIGASEHLEFGANTTFPAGLQIQPNWSFAFNPLCITLTWLQFTRKAILLKFVSFKTRKISENRRSCAVLANATES